MMSVALFSSASLNRPSRRLVIGLALSMLAHLLLVTGLRPTTTPYMPPRPFQVQIRPAEPRSETLPAVAADAGFPAAVATARPVPIPQPIEPPVPNTSATPAPGIDLQFIPDNYLTSREVDVRAVPANDVDLVYPAPAYQRRLKGRVILRLLINERGGLDHVSVLESEPRGVFEDAALTATRALQFAPAKKNGRNVKSRQDIEVLFDPYESISTP